MTNPSLVPTVTLRSGDTMPVLGLGTFGSDKYSPVVVAEAVGGALDTGYRHFDCASIYGNEREIGEVLGSVAKRGIPREELWITSKVWNDQHSRVAASCEKSLRDLQLDVLDLYLVHWPFPNSHGVGVDVTSRDPHAVPYQHERYMETWSQMESLVERGLVRNIGTSNMTISKLEGLLRDATILPSANELELHPHFQQPELFNYVVNAGMIPIGYSPLGSPSRPARDRTPEDTFDMEDPAILAAAARLSVSPAIVCVLWQIQRGSVPIPFSVKPSQYAPMLEAVTTLSLTEAEMTAIAQSDRECRLIKGQVFLWEGATDWQELWL
jgi:alcohol dehydrogenase (NADP+)